MTHRIPLSLSPAGHAEREVSLQLSPALIAHHTARAHRMRSEAMWCLFRQAWHKLTRRAVRPCPDLALLTPA